MKRYREEKEDESGLILYEQSLPDELWCDIILTRFSYQIHAYRYNEFVALMTINKRFHWIVYNNVIPSIVEIGWNLLYLYARREMLTTFRSLRTLHVGCISKITDDDIKCLSHISQLRLILNDRITDSCVKTFTRLEKLNLDNNIVITDDGIRNLTLLRTLKIRSATKITDDAIKRLSLRSLNLSMNKVITDEGIKGLLQLGKLNLTLNAMITNEGIKDMPLRKLNLSCNNRITNECITRFTLLETLDLSSNEMITDKGIKGLTNLTNLKLEGDVKIGAQGLLALPKLRLLELRSGVSITPDFLEVLKSRGVTVKVYKNLF